MADLLFEIGTEELPHWYVQQGSQELAELLRSRLAAAGIPAARFTTYATPRRLAVLAGGLPDASARKVEELRGPPASVAFDEAGQPTRAALAFAQRNGVGVQALERRETDKGSYMYARVEKGGQPTALLLPDLLVGITEDLPAPRKMRWGQQETPFLRPIAWLLALLDDTPLQLEVAGVRSGSTTRGHRYLAPGQLQVKAPAQYAALLEEAWVLADRNKRRQVTQQGIDRVAAEAGLTPLDDAELLDEVTDLVEWPFPIGGTFEAEYLELPEEVLATVMISHQRFFPTRAASGKLAASFVGVSNNRVVDEAVVRRGYQQVLAGRLYDARFFWQADRRKSLSQHAWDLSGIAFQKELGSMADKTDRVSVTAGYLLEALGVLEEQADALRRALPIFRADLATEMVYEFPELEGVMGRAYALAEGLPQATADALLGGVKPKTHEDDLPATAPGAVLALADRADKLIGFFALGKRPSGSADPFGLRRDGLAMARILAARGWDLPLIDLFEAAAAPYAASADLQIDQQTLQEASEFVWDRVAAQLQERASVPVVRAAIRGSRTIVGAARRVELLNYLTHSPDFGDLMALYKRAANLAAKAEESAEVNPELFREAPEAPLYLALDEARTGVQRLLSAAKQQLPAWDLRDAPAARLTDLDDATRQVVDLRPPLDAFLDDVLVMVDDQRIKANRLALLSEVVVVLRRLGELGELEGAE